MGVFPFMGINILDSSCMARKFQNIAMCYAIPSYSHNIESTLHICVHMYYITEAQRIVDRRLEEEEVDPVCSCGRAVCGATSIRPSPGSRRHHSARLSIFEEGNQPDDLGVEWALIGCFAAAVKT